MNLIYLLIIIFLALAIFAAIFWAARRIHTLRSISEKAEQDLLLQLEKKNAGIQEGRFREKAVFESMQEGVLVIDPQERIVLANPSFFNFFGPQVQKIEGRPYWEILRDSRLNQLIGHSLKEKKASQMEESIASAKATFDIRVSPVLNGGDYLGVTVIFYDVTRLKEYERLRQEFVANVSHELKTPLTSILGYVETLKEGAIEDTENRGRFLTIIEEQSKKLHLLIEDLLLLSRMESLSSLIQKDTLSLRKETDKILEMLSKETDQKKLGVHNQIAQDFQIQAEKSSFERVLRNVIENAVQYNIPGGEIELEAEKKEQDVYIRVRDTGVGIAPADLPRIFERFYRADRSRSRESGGSGLGLSIAKHILERHGGRIEVESQLQKGSRFTIVLPA